LEENNVLRDAGRKKITPLIYLTVVNCEILTWDRSKILATESHQCKKAFCRRWPLLQGMLRLRSAWHRSCERGKGYWCRNHHAVGSVRDDNELECCQTI